MRILLALFALGAVAYAQDSCAAFGDWSSATSCLWFPISDMRQKALDACGIEFDASQIPDPPMLPGVTIPDKCGFCSHKIQCRSRSEKSDGCFPYEGKHSICTEHSAPCDMPKFPITGDCSWHLAMIGLKQCLNRPDIPDWKKDGLLKWAEQAPSTNCKKAGEGCKCCCHPYVPSADGSTCEEQTAPSCKEEFPAFNDWSECLWLPLKNIVKGVKEHCNVNYKTPGDMVIPTPPGFQIPDKCGYCSFKIRCAKRSTEDVDGNPKKCFGLKTDKKACGEDDCEGCGSPCSMPKNAEMIKQFIKINKYFRAFEETAFPFFRKNMGGSCNIMAFVRRLGKSRIKNIMKMPYWRRRGMIAVFSNLPMARCVEDENSGQCKCCCHPYVPSADGSTCELVNFCSLPADLGAAIFERK